VGGTVTEFPVAAGSRPVAITAGPDGGLWFVEAKANKVCRIDTTGKVTGEFGLPTANADPEGIAAGPDGGLWFTEAKGNKVGRITISGTIKEYALPTPNAAPQGIAAGPDGALWFTETAAARIGRVTPAGNVQEVAGLGASSSPFGIALGPDGRLWFAERDANQVGSLAARTANELFVTALYHDLLHRDPEDAGLSAWSGLLDRGMLNRAQAAQGIMGSAEHLADVVQELYTQLLHRSAEPEGLAGWVGYLGQGHSERDLEAQIMASPEYFRGRGEGTGGGFITAVFQDLTYQDSDRSRFVSLQLFLAQSPDDPVGGASIRLGVVTALLHSWSADAAAAETWFARYLHRPIDSFSFAGLIDALQGGLPDGGFIAGILGSAEYFTRNT
jgi:hypothetical protein